MAKLKDILRAVAEKFNIQELEALAGSGAIQELEIEDEAASKVKTGLTNLVTIEDAAKIPAVYDVIAKDLFPKHKKRILTDLEAKQNEVVKTLFGDTKLTELKDKSAEERQELISQWMLEEREAAKSNPAVEDLKNKIRESYDKINALTSEKEELSKSFSQKEAEINNQWESRIINTEVGRKAAGYNWQDSFDDRAKKVITSDIINSISQKAILKQTEDGRIKLYDRANPDLEFHDGSKPVEFDKLFEQELSPYLKKSESGEDRQDRRGAGRAPQPANLPKPGTLAYERYQNIQKQKVGA